MKKKTIKLEQLNVVSFTTGDMKNLKGGDEWTEMRTDGCSDGLFCEQDTIMTGI